MNLLAVIGPTALYLLFAWLLAAIVASDLANRKGFGEKPGLATGLLLSAAGAIVWLLVPARRGSQWSRYVKLVDVLAAIGAVVLLGSLFAPWYSGGGNFFDELTFYDVLVPIGAAVAYVQVHARATGHPPGDLGIVALVASVVALLVAIVALVTPSDGVEWGAYLTVVAGLATAALVAVASRVERAQATKPADRVEAREAGAEAS